MKRVIRRIAVLFIGLAILIFTAAYTTNPVGEKEMYIKAKADSVVTPAPEIPLKAYQILQNRVSAEILRAEKEKADVAYAEFLKAQEEAKKQQQSYEKWVKELKKQYTGKLVAFTFDDGPGRYTEKLLDGLKERKAHATFMLLGSCAARYEDLVQRMAKEGHQIGNHTWNHPNLANATVETLRSELSTTEKLLKSLGYKKTIVVRPPYGAYDDLVKEEAGVPLILWNVDTEDWRHKGDAKTVYNNIMRDAHDGAVILLHDIYGSSVDAALKAMDRLEKDGYQFVTVDELFAIRDVKLKNGKIYYSALPKE